MKTETNEFDGWRKIEPHGIGLFPQSWAKWLKPVFLLSATSIVLFGILLELQINLPTIIILFSIVGALISGIMLALTGMMPGNVKVSCQSCGSEMKKVTTLPDPENENLKGDIISEKTEHVYRLVKQKIGPPRAFELRNLWLTCQDCKTYFPVKMGGMTDIGFGQNSIQQQEERYLRNSASYQKLSSKKIILKS